MSGEFSNERPEPGGAAGWLTFPVLTGYLSYFRHLAGFLSDKNIELREKEEDFYQLKDNREYHRHSF
jgi:hypothetical protein